MIIFFMFTGFILLGLKLFSIQIVKHDYYAEIAEKQQNKSQKLKAERGSIIDRNGELLAITKNDISLYVDKRMLNKNETDSLTSFIASVFNKPRKYYQNLIDKGRNNVLLEKKVSRERLLKIDDFYIDGFIVQEDFSRVYPYGSLSSHVLGYVDNECNGVYGIEKQYDKYLRGKDGIKFIENDVLGRTISVKENDSRKPVAGNNIILTINKTYQTILEKELIAGIHKFHGDSATGIIMNPKTGEILAMATMPDFDPANHGKFQLSEKRNRAITDPYEPGSIIKPIIMSMLIEEKLIKEDEIINTENGDFRYRTTHIRDTHPHAYLTVRGVLEESSNIGMAKLSDRLEENTFYKYLRDFGFGNITSVDLPGESNGFLKKPKNYSKISKPFMSFGYELSATPVQLISAFSSIINGGNLMKPFIVDKITSPDGTVLYSNKPEKIRSVISSSTSDKIIDFMIGVVEEGTATNAKLNNVLVGGKTGTAQMLIEGSYSKKEYNSSFIGFFPAEDPSIIILIKVSSPDIGRYGGQVSAPVFKRIAESIIDADLQIIPDNMKIQRRKEYLENLLKEDRNSRDQNIFKFSNIGNPPEVKREKPSVIKGMMPNLVNMTIRDAVAILNELGIKYKISGDGKVLEQSINPDEAISSDRICILRCETKKLADLRLN